MQEVGIEGLTLEFPATRYPGHFLETGQNAIYFDGVVDSWVRDVAVVNPDYASSTWARAPARTRSTARRHCACRSRARAPRTGTSPPDATSASPPGDFGPRLSFVAVRGTSDRTPPSDWHAEPIARVCPDDLHASMLARRHR